MTIDLNATTSPTMTITDAFPDPTAARLRIVEAALFVSAEPLSIEQLTRLFDSSENIDPHAMQNLLAQLQQESEQRGVMLVEVAGGWRYQSRQEFQPWLLKLQEDKPRRYGRALLETLALIVYRQPITRGEIEEVRGVAVATTIMRTLLERRWIKPVGRRDIPGRPVTFGSTDTFLNDFGLQLLSDLPTLSHIKSMAELEPGFDFDGAPASDVSFAQILGAYNTNDCSDERDDFDDDLAAHWQLTDAVNAAFTEQFQPTTEPPQDDSFEAKTHPQQHPFERQNNQHEKNYDNPSDEFNGNSG